MRPIEHRRHPEEKFYFDNSQLIVDINVLPPHYPSVELINNHSTFETIVNPEGIMISKEVKGQGTKSSMAPGTRLHGVEARDGETVTSSYQVEPGDILIARRESASGIYGEPIVMVPADKPLPDDEQTASYQPLGIITTEGKLVAWGYEGHRAQELVDHILANKLVKSRLDNFILDIEVTFRGPIAERLAASEVVRRYIEWVQEEHGKDYYPHQEPKDRWSQFSEEDEVSLAQLARY